ncbi:unnamed protein product [Urochloa decumbens]|uniref:COBRA C-terminal domain-containing protein n=1 Tax=Urochloa decumbens TaxID=240449 RepID=A0ABC9GUB8_9POAL
MALLQRPSLVFLVLLVARAVVAQQQQQPDVDGGCNGILLTYSLQGRQKIRPFVPAAAEQQAYSFRANATVVNGGTRALRSWALLVTFAHGEILVGVDGAVLTSGAELPYNTSAAAEDGTSLSGYPQAELLTPIATAGDLSKTQATVNLVGTLFAGPEPYVPLPSALSLADPSYACPPATITNASTSLSTCCVPTLLSSASAATPSPSSSPRRSGDLVITYDVVQAHETTYLALVTLDNGAPLGRLDGWQLSWEWQRGEFIRAMRGAYPREVGSAACLYGPQGQHYKGLDFSKVLNCDRRPVVMDLPPSRADDADMGRINHCCRNGTILPKSMGVAQSTSAFQMDVYKMPPDLNRTKLYPPAGFQVRGSSPLNPDYACGQPVPVRPSEFPDPSGLPSTTLAVASWQVVCNITTQSQSQQAPPKSSTPRCCVSFSAFYNESVVPCRTCACGCPAPTKTSQQPASSCSTTAPAMLLPPYALLMPSDRRAKEALTWADQKDLGPVPNPMPCADNCAFSVNWHVASDFAGGWTARLTLFNWQPDADMPDWFAAVVMADEAAYDGFEQAYSFNATAIGNGTIFIHGREGFNDFLLKETNMSGVDYPVPGKVQSVLSFTKKTSAAIDVIAGHGFPSKVFFNGDECAMPLRIPSPGARPNTGGFILPMLSSSLVASALLLLL